MACVDDHLLHDGLLLLEFNELFLHVFVLHLLLDDAVRQLFEVSHYMGVH